LDETLTWVAAATLFSVWLTIFSFLIFYVIVSDYRKTFWSTQTAWQNSQSYFLENEGNDECRLTLFTCNRLQWEKSIGKEVKVWTLSNWSKWEEEKPDWFTAVLKAKIPDEYIPATFVKALGGSLRERRGSARLSFSVGDEAVELRRRLSLEG
jgi:hypothetical protein